jgi:hypothetical protein
MTTKLSRVLREYDRLVAEHVMGWTALRWHLLAETYVGKDPKQPSSAFEEVVPYYTTDISAAWEVVEMMKRMDEHVRYHFDDLTCDRYCIWELTPEIICKAALKAVGVDVD